MLESDYIATSSDAEEETLFIFCQRTIANCLKITETLKPSVVAWTRNTSCWLYGCPGPEILRMQKDFPKKISKNCIESGYEQISMLPISPNMKKSLCQFYECKGPHICFNNSVPGNQEFIRHFEDCNIKKLIGYAWDEITRYNHELSLNRGFRTSVDLRDCFHIDRY